MSDGNEGIDLRRLLDHPDKVDRFAWGVVCIAIAGWVVCAFAPIIFGVSSDKSGPWGDTFGAASSFFSLFTLIGLAYTIAIQHIELRDAKEEARKSEKSRRTAEKLMAEQAKALMVSAKLNAANYLAQSHGKLAELRHLQSETHDYDEMNFYILLMECFFRETEFRSSMLNIDEKSNSVKFKHFCDTAKLIMFVKWNSMFGEQQDSTSLQLAIFKSIRWWKHEFAICRDLAISLELPWASELHESSVQSEHLEMKVAISDWNQPETRGAIQKDGQAVIQRFWSIVASNSEFTDSPPPSDTPPDSPPQPIGT